MTKVARKLMADGRWTVAGGRWPGPITCGVDVKILGLWCLSQHKMPITKPPGFESGSNTICMDPEQDPSIIKQK